MGVDDGMDKEVVLEEIRVEMVVFEFVVKVVKLGIIVLDDIEGDDVSTEIVIEDDDEVESEVTSTSDVKGVGKDDIIVGGVDVDISE